MAEPKISIIVPTRNRVEELRLCLGRLVPQLPSDGSIDLHVGDDSERDETETLLRNEFPMVLRHPGPRIGPGANRNVCARMARGQWLIFLDDDCLPDPGLIAGYVAAMKPDDPEPKFFLSGPIFRTDENKDSLLWEAPQNNKPDLLPPSCNFAMPRAIFLDSGGFDERFSMSFEDMEFFARLNLQDIPVHFVPAASVDHPSRPLLSASRLARRWEARVISSYDFGADSAQILKLLPRHILLVIISRFRGRSFSLENMRAASVFATEFVIAMFRLPGWISRYRRQPRSAFWLEKTAEGKAPRRFGL